MRLLVTIIILFVMNDSTLFDFETASNIDNWKIVDDVVMGGRSNGNFEIDKDGHGKFSGTVSLENNGGFSSLRYILDNKDVSAYSKLKLRIKGDGKAYQFRIKTSTEDYASYIYKFETRHDIWMTIEIPFEQMYPAYRGQALRRPNFQGDQIAQIGFLIGNKKEQSFELLIDNIILE